MLRGYCVVMCGYIMRSWINSFYMLNYNFKSIIIIQSQDNFV